MFNVLLPRGAVDIERRKLRWVFQVTVFGGERALFYDSNDGYFNISQIEVSVSVG